MIFPISDEEGYRSLSLDAWRRNAGFWDKSRKIHPHIAAYLEQQLDAASARHVIDVGCGNGWLYEEIIRRRSGISYCGVDYNDEFIRVVESRYPGNEFHCLDFTRPLPAHLAGRFDLAVSCLSLIEMADIETAFRNFRTVLAAKGTLILITLNPYFELVRLNSSYPGLESDLALFRAGALPKYYRKEILLDGKHTGKYYFGVLHTTENLIACILDNKFSISGFRELNFEDGAIQAPIYHAYKLDAT